MAQGNPSGFKLNTGTLSLTILQPLLDLSKSAVAEPSVMVNATSVTLQPGLPTKAVCDQMQLDHKLQIEQGLKGIGLARQPKSSEEHKGGRAHNTLVDDLVLEFDQHKPGSDKLQP